MDLNDNVDELPDDEDIPVGERLGTQRLYAVDAVDALEQGDQIRNLFSNPPPIPTQALVDYEMPMPERKDMPRPPERKDLPKPEHDPRKPAKQPHHPPKKRPLAARLADANWREFWSTSFELLGIMAITAGSSLIRAWLGLLVLGLCLILLGVATGITRSE